MLEAGFRALAESLKLLLQMRLGRVEAIHLDAKQQLQNIGESC